MRFSEISLKDAVEFIVDNRGKTVPIQDSGIPLIATNCISNEKLYPAYENIRYVSDEIFNNWFRAHPKPNDIILTNKGSKNGAICMVPDPVDFCIAQDMVALRAKKDAVYPKYLFAALRSPLVQSRIKELNVDSVIPHFKKTDFDKLYFPLPNYDIQIAVGDFYFNLCNKIHTNLLINQTMEEMAQAIFKSWFVDFDPVKAKMNGEQPVGMDEATAALFPNKLVESEFGLMPEGWKLVPVGELLDKAIGGDWGKEEPDEKHTEEVRIVRGTDIPRLHGGSIDSVPVRYVESKKLKTRQLERGDIVIEVSGGSKDQPTGRTLFISDNILKRLELPTEPASFCRRFKPESYEIGLLLAIHFQLMYEAGKTWEYQNQSTGISNFQTTYFLQAELVVVPSQEVLDVFVKQVSPMMDMIHSDQNIELAKLRDTLLPKLLSGEIELESAEETFEESA